MFLGDEDCLYVNVYTPNLNPLKKLDVLVFIHGGAFMFNYGGLYGPQIVLERDVVYVNFNYRLGPLGELIYTNYFVCAFYGGFKSGARSGHSIFKLKLRISRLRISKHRG